MDKIDKICRKGLRLESCQSSSIARSGLKSGVAASLVAPSPYLLRPDARPLPLVRDGTENAEEMIRWHDGVKT